LERNLTPEEARKELINLVRQGRTIVDALKVIGRSRSWYDTQRREAEGFAAYIDNARLRTSDLADEARSGLSDFAEFSEKYLGAKVWDHMLNVVDMLEGKEPRWIHPAMTYEKGSAGLSRLLVNVPPNHAKTMTITINYVTYRVVKNPNINVIVISKTQEQAKKFLYAIKQRLTHPRYADLQAAFGPTDGYKATADMWSANKVYLGGGQLLVVGTRVSATDLYKELRNTQHYTDGIVPWSYLSMPAVLEYADNPKDWKTLWAKSEQPLTEDDTPDENGFFDRWTGPRLTAVRNEAGPSKWSLVYQNLDIAENAIFDPMCVRGAVNGMRKSGALVAGAAGHPDNAQNFYRIIGIDPAMSGDTAAVAYAVDRRTHKRYVMDVHVMSSPTPAAIRSLIREWTDAYKPHTVIVESNAFQLFLTQDEEIRNFLSTRGINYRPHYTGNNKQDPEFGVASLAPLFGTVIKRDGNNNNLKHAGDNMIELPDASRNEHIKKLIEQLVVWQPGVQGKRLKMDAVMALWFCEIVARDVLLTSANVPNFLKNEFTPQKQIEDRYIVNLDDLAAAQRIARL